MKVSRQAAIVAVMAGLLILVSTSLPAQQTPYDVVIRGGHVVDGSDAEPTVVCGGLRRSFAAGQAL